jgi:hypothetical protein
MDPESEPTSQETEAFFRFADDSGSPLNPLCGTTRGAVNGRPGKFV